MNAKEVFKKIITTTPVELNEERLNNFSKMSVNQMWKEIDFFLEEYGFALYCASSLNPSDREKFSITNDEFELNMLGLRELGTNNVVLFDDITYFISKSDKIDSAKHMYLDFYKRIQVIAIF